MVVSGFIMAHNFIIRRDLEPWGASSTIWKFYARRMFRLYPLYVIAILASAAIRFPEGADLEDIVAHLTFAHGLFPKYCASILSTAWSLSLEMQFYLVFSFLFVLLFECPRVYALTAFSLAATSFALCSIYLLGHYAEPGRLAHFSQPSLLLFKMPLFLLGMTAAAFGHRLIQAMPFNIALLIVMLSNGKLTDCVALLIVSLLLIHRSPQFAKPLITVLEPALRALSGKISIFGADISYAMYLTHPIILSILSIVSEPLLLAHPLEGFAIFMVSTICISAILHFVVERPCIELGKWLLSQPTPPTNSSSTAELG